MSEILSSEKDVRHDGRASLIAFKFSAVNISRLLINASLWKITPGGEVMSHCTPIVICIRTANSSKRPWYAAGKYTPPFRLIRKMHLTRRDAKTIAKLTPVPNRIVAHDSVDGRAARSAERPAHVNNPNSSIWPRNRWRRFGEVFLVLHNTKSSKAAIISIEITERTMTGITHASFRKPLSACTKFPR